MAKRLDIITDILLKEVKVGTIIVEDIGRMAGGV